jgi:hypothetical protein
VPVVCVVYYSDGAFHASGVTTNLASGGGCLRGTHAVRVGMELMLLIIPPTRKAILIKKATVRWAKYRSFGVKLDEQDPATTDELEEVPFDRPHLPHSFLTH